MLNSKIGLLSFALLGLVATTAPSEAFLGFSHNAGAQSSDSTTDSAFLGSGQQNAAPDTTYHAGHVNNGGWRQKLSAPGRIWQHHQAGQQYNHYLNNITVFSGAPVH